MGARDNMMRSYKSGVIPSLSTNFHFGSTRHGIAAGLLGFTYLVIMYRRLSNCIKAEEFLLNIMKDGLYRVSTSSFCAGFVVQNGKIARCAPILRKRLRTHWVAFAVFIQP